MSYTVAQNTSFYTIASVLQKVISFLYFAIIARLIGVENTGVYFFAITFTLVWIVLADFGFGTAMTRESSRTHQESIGYINTILWSKLFFGLVVYALIVLSANLLNYSELTKSLIYLSGITMFFDNIHNIFYAVLRAGKNLFYESLGIVLSQLLTLTIGTIALLSGWPLYWLILAYTIPSFLNVLYSSFWVYKKYNWRLRFSFDTNLLKKFLLLAWPFALAGIISRFYTYSDSLLMSKILTEHDLGLWGVVFKISSAFYFIALALSTSAFPVFSSLYLTDKSALVALYERTYRYLFFLAFPISGGIFVLAKPAINLIYGSQYNGAVLPLQIFILSLIFTFLTFINGAMLNAIDKQKVQTLLVGLALVISIALNIILLSYFGIIGAAITAVVAGGFLAKTGFWLCHKYTNISLKNIFKYCNQTFWPAVVMTGVVYYLAGHINFIYTIPVGAVVYLCLVYWLGGIDKQLFLKMKGKILG